MKVPPYDFAPVIAAALRKSNTDRGDEREAHVSDLYGCDLATWARRRGLPQAPFEARTLVKFQMGNQGEADLATPILAFLESEGWAVRRDVAVWWDPNANAHTLTEPREREGLIIGHLDLLAERGPERMVGEIKTTSFLRGIVPTLPSLHYAQQAAGYAVAVLADSAFVQIRCRESGKDAPTFWVDLDAMRPWVIERGLALIANTDPAVPFAPKANPQHAWLCKTCRYAPCPMNKNPALTGGR